MSAPCFGSSPLTLAPVYINPRHPGDRAVMGHEDRSDLLLHHEKPLEGQEHWKINMLPVEYNLGAKNIMAGAIPAVDQGRAPSREEGGAALLHQGRAAARSRHSVEEWKDQKQGSQGPASWHSS